VGNAAEEDVVCKGGANRSEQVVETMGGGDDLSSVQPKMLGGRGHVLKARYATGAI
jgi:hypothetical protein